jgi:hypothetical protein
MTNTELLNKLKAEIERLVKNEKQLLDAYRNDNNYRDAGIQNVLLGHDLSLLSYLSELSEEIGQEKPCEELEGEINRTYRNGSVTDTSDIDHNSYENIASHFAEWGRKQVLQEIADGKIHPVDKITAAWLNDE